MNKYKLIKEYPGSPELGYIINYGTYDYGYNHQFTHCGYFLYNSPVYPEKYPEFWEKVVEKDYEILSIQHEYGSIASYDKELDNLEKQVYKKIHSVKRLSDGEIFSIGDTVDGVSYEKIIIDEIWLNPSCTSQILFNHKDEGIDFLKANKSKQPLFTTEDGKDIYYGDTYYFVYDWVITTKRATNGHYVNLSNYYFSTKEKAEEYIIMNKPCLSIRDVLSVGQRVIVDEGKLKQIVKKRLCKS